MKLTPLLLVSILFPLLAPAQEEDPGFIHFYQDRYALKNPYDKLVNNHGEGLESLYGTRNVRAVLNGVVYRGGANNAYNKYGKRSNQNPLPLIGLKNLCEEGFGTAVYLYTTNYASAPKATFCKSVLNSSHKLNYLQASAHMSEDAARSVLKLIHQRLTNPSDQGPIYLHCWNGWHASGLMSAYTLRQFCGYTADQAVAYWNRNTDGNNVGSNYDRLRAKIKAFQPDPQLSISPELQALVCPRS